MIVINEVINKAIKNDLVVSVYDGEEWSIKKSQNYALLLDHINSVDECKVSIKDKADKRIALFWYIDNEISDYTEESTEFLAEYL